jgi:hypothetical protein
VRHSTRPWVIIHEVGGTMIRLPKKTSELAVMAISRHASLQALSAHLSVMTGLTNVPPT